MEAIPDELKWEICSFLAEDPAAWKLPPVAAASRAWLLAYVANLPRCLCDIRREALLRLLLSFNRNQRWRGVLYLVLNDVDTLFATPTPPGLGLAVIGAHWADHALEMLLHRMKRCRGLRLAALPTLRSVPAPTGLEELHVSNCPSLEPSSLLACIRASAATLITLTLRYLPRVAGSSLRRHAPLPQLPVLAHLRAIRCGALGDALLSHATSPAGVHATLQGERVALLQPSATALHSLTLVCTSVVDRALEGAVCNAHAARTLRCLSLTRCSAVEKPLLRCAALESVAFVRCDMLSDEVVSTLCAGCPRLQALTLRLCVNLVRPVIRGGTLRELEVSGCHNMAAAAIARALGAAPYLEALEADDTALGWGGTLEEYTAPCLSWLSARRARVGRDDLDRMVVSGVFPRLRGAALSDGVWQRHKSVGLESLHCATSP